MKFKKLCVMAILGLMIFSGTVFAANVEDALTPCPEESVYGVLKLSDTSAFLKWIFSSENIELFMPLILMQEESNEIIGAIEMISMFTENTPLKSIALVVGAQGDKVPVPFFQIALTANEEMDPIVKRIADGSATAVDIAKLLLGKDNPLAPLVVSMIKIEKTDENILRIDNELFVKAYDGIVLASLSEEGVKAAVNALDHSDMRLLEAKPRKFNSPDFALLHIDAKTSKLLDDEKDKDEDDIDLEEYFDKPLHLEFDFARVPDKFTIKTAMNFFEALKKEYAEKLAKEATQPVKGGYINLAGEQSPLLAFGGVIDLSPVKDNPDALAYWKIAVGQLKNRFGITEDDILNFFKGPFSVNVNDNVGFEGFKIPAVYISQTGKEGAAENVYNTLAKSPHFQKVQEGVLQLDSSISPIACFVQNKGQTLGINLAELENLSKTPELKPTAKELMERESISSLWLDFEGVQAWINESGVLVMLEPVSKFMGFGEIFDSAKEIITAKLSVPSMSICCESLEVFRTEFNINPDVKAGEGFLSKVIKIARKYIESNKD